MIAYAGTLYRSIRSAAVAWAYDALPDTSVIDSANGRRGDARAHDRHGAGACRPARDDTPSCDPDVAAADLERHWWHEAQRIGEGQPDGLTEREWRDACRSALADRIRAAQVRS